MIYHNFELLLDMIAGILNVLMNLINERRLGQRQLLSDYIEPLFQQLIDVHEDYMSSVNEIVLLIKDHNFDPSKIHATILSRKQRLDHIRRLIYDLNVACLLSPYSRFARRSHSSPRTVKEAAFKFARSVREYFECTIGNLPPTTAGSTWYAGLIDLIELMAENKIDRNECLNEANLVLEELPEKWGAVTFAYAQMKALCRRAV